MRFISRGLHFALYLIGPVVAAGTPLLVFPAVTHAYGAIGLAIVGIGQSVGSVAAVMGDQGWSVVGPQKMAAARDDTHRARIMGMSLATRCLALTILVPLTVGVGLFLAPADGFAVGLIAAGAAAGALSPAWAYIGMNRPGLILVAEAIPKLVCVGTSAILIAGGLDIAVYGIALIVAALASCVTGAVVLRVKPSLAEWRLRDVLGVMRSQLAIAVSRSITAGFTAAPIAVVAAFAPAAVPLFTAVDRMYRMALSVLAAVPNRLQSWIGSASPEDRSWRSRRQLLINSLVGLAAAVGYGIMAPWGAGLLFSRTVTFSSEVAWLSAAVVFTVCVSRGVGLSLVAFSATRWLLPSSAAGAVIGLISVALLSSNLGVVGAVIGVLSAEAVAAGVQALGLSTERRRR